MGNLKDLKTQVEGYFAKQGHKESVCKRYRHTWKHLEAFMKLRMYEAYTPAVGEEFLNEWHKGAGYATLTPRQKERYRHIDVLSDIVNHGHVRSCVLDNKTYSFEGEPGQPFQEFIEEYATLRAPSTLRRYEERITVLYNFLKRENIALDEFSFSKAIRFLKELSGGRSDTDRDNIVMSLRVFIRYLCEKGYLPEPLPEKWMALFKLRYVRTKKIPSVYTQTEVDKILSAIDLTHPQGKRDYAMALLAARYGLRVSDIIGLRFCNILWEENKLSLVQAKTGKKVTLPLSEEVGSALIDYIRNGRPDVESPCVFLTSHAPYKELGSNVLCSNIADWMRSAGIDSTGKKKGPHALRHSLATNLLEANTRLPVISEILGHSSTQSTMVYTRVNIDQLRKCALDVPFVPTSFYDNLYG